MDRWATKHPSDLDLAGVLARYRDNPHALGRTDEEIEQFFAEPYREHGSPQEPPES